ncbi:hypothetical protein [Moheibacter lacus]|uniref:Oxygen tolerance n=1 Tax=Moheibacter lacus TaxID=2745851 RepID=A0A838ZMH8_9FLAO|nr:hypothetical protein [Moheibacter lacus]MBA5629000.1 hypothetical protein [Moheibacter lacus]
MRKWMDLIGWKIEDGRWKFFFLSFVLCLMSNFSFGQIDTRIDTAHIKIGEPIQYTLTVPIHDKSEIKLPELKDTLSFHIEILNQRIDTIFEGEKKNLVQHLTLTSFDPGNFLIRSLPVVVDEDTLLSHSFQIMVDEVKIDSANLAGFPIKTIMEEEYTWRDYWDKYWMYFAVGALVFLALLIVAILFLRDKKRKEIGTKTIKTPYEEAKDALKNLDKKKYLTKGQINPYYSELSFVLRRYLGKVFHFSSLELLSDDLVDHFQKTTHLDKNQIDQLKEFLFESDLVKFAKAVPDENRHEFYRKWVEDLIEKIKPMELEDETIQELRPNEKYRKLK